MPNGTDRPRPPVAAALLALLTVVTASSCISARAADAPTFVNPSHVPRRFGAADGKPLVYAVMGDSTAAGQGADYDRGIAVSTARALARSGPVTLVNVGISGARIHDVLATELGDAAEQKPDVVLLAVAANDVTHLTSIASMKRDLREVVHRLRAVNGHVAIVVTGSPDMGSPPRVPWLLRPLAAWRTRAVNRMVVQLAREEALTFAPIATETGEAFRRDRSLFAADRFHPNERGYALWSAVLIPALQRALESPLR